MAHGTPHVGSPTMGPHGQAGAKTRVQGCVWAKTTGNHETWGVCTLDKCLACYVPTSPKGSGLWGGEGEPEGADDLHQKAEETIAVGLVAPIEGLWCG